jgi:Ca2+-transporting ATPase
VMNRPPKNPAKQFFDSRQIRRIMAFGLIMGGLAFILFWYLLGIYSYEVAVSIMFTSVVCFQWCNGLQAQLEHEPYLLDIRRSISINPYIFYGIGVGIVLQLTAIYVIPGVFGIVPLAPEHWRYVITLSLAAFFVVEVIKWLEYRGSHPTVRI